MNNEVKEILEKIKSVSDSDDYVDFVGTEFKPLLDYIIYIQDKYEEAIRISLVDHKYASKKEDEAITYKSKIDKAIEYIKQCSWSNGIDNEIQYSLYVPTLLNILQGDDESENKSNE